MIGLSISYGFRFSHAIDLFSSDFINWITATFQNFPHIRWILTNSGIQGVLKALFLHHLLSIHILLTILIMLSVWLLSMLMVLHLTKIWLGIWCVLISVNDFWVRIWIKYHNVMSQKVICKYLCFKHSFSFFVIQNTKKRDFLPLFWKKKVIKKAPRYKWLKLWILKVWNTSSTNPWKFQILMNFKGVAP